MWTLSIVVYYLFGSGTCKGARGNMTAVGRRGGVKGRGVSVTRRQRHITNINNIKIYLS